VDAKPLTPRRGRDSQLELFIAARDALLGAPATWQELASRLHPTSERTVKRLLASLKRYGPSLGFEVVMYAPHQIGREGDSRVRYYAVRELTNGPKFITSRTATRHDA
jgi:hypothetical protein